MIVVSVELILYKIRLYWILAVVSIFLNSVFAAGGGIDEERWLIDIPAAKLSETLPVISSQTGLRFSYETEKILANDISVDAIVGSYSLVQLMQVLLKDSVFEYAYDGHEVVALRINTHAYKARMMGQALREIIVLGHSGRNKQQRLSASTTATSVQAEYLPKGTELIGSTLLNVPGLLIDSIGDQFRVNRRVRNIAFAGAYEDGLPLLFESALSFGNVEEYFRLDETVERIEVSRGGASGVLKANGQGAVVDLLGVQNASAHSDGLLKLTLVDNSMRRIDLMDHAEINSQWDFYAAAYLAVSDGLEEASIETIGDEGGQITFGLRRELESGAIMFKYRHMEDLNPFVIESSDFVLNAYDGIDVRLDYLMVGLDIDFENDWSLWHRVRVTEAVTDMNTSIMGNLPQPILLTANPVLGSQFLLLSSVHKPIDHFVQDLQLKHEYRRHDVTFGVYYAQQESEDFQINQIAGPNFINYRYELNDTALYALDKWHLTENLDLDIGLRTIDIDYEYQGSSMLPPDNSIIAPPVLTNRQAQNSSRETGYAIGLNYALNSDSSLQAYLSQGYRNIIVDEMLFSDVPVRLEGFKALELGYRQLSDDFDIFATLYKTKSDDEGQVNGINILGIFGEVYLPENDSLGLDMEMLWRPNGMFELSVYAGLYDSEFSADTSVQSQLGSIEKSDLRQVRVSPFVYFPWGDTYLNFRYVDERLRYSTGDVFSPDYTTVDLGFRYHFSEDVDLHLIGVNLNDGGSLYSDNLSSNTNSQQASGSTFLPIGHGRTLHASISYSFE